MNSAIDLLESRRPVHIIGAGGVGMSGLALLLHQLGYRVSASDKNPGPYLKKLIKQNITAYAGSKPGEIPGDAVVFYSSAIPPSDEERQYASRNGLPVFSRHPLIEFITSKFYTIAVAGAHGKTTTAAWVAELLVEAGLDPTALIGGTLHSWQSNFRSGSGQVEGRPLLVIEADESDRSF